MTPLENMTLLYGCVLSRTGTPPFATEFDCPVERTWLMSKCWYGVGFGAAGPPSEPASPSGVPPASGCAGTLPSGPSGWAGSADTAGPPPAPGPSLEHAALTASRP